MPHYDSSKLPTPKRKTDRSYLDRTRERIQASLIINKLKNHILNNTEMTATQVTAALGLLKKVVPDLQAIEMQVEVSDKRTVTAQPMDLRDWQDQYSSGPVTIDAKAETVN